MNRDRSRKALMRQTAIDSADSSFFANDSNSDASCVFSILGKQRKTLAALNCGKKQRPQRIREGAIKYLKKNKNNIILTLKIKGIVFLKILQFN